MEYSSNRLIRTKEIVQITRQSILWFKYDSDNVPIKELVDDAFDVLESRIDDWTSVIGNRPSRNYEIFMPTKKVVAGEKHHAIELALKSDDIDFDHKGLVVYGWRYEN